MDVWSRGDSGALRMCRGVQAPRSEIVAFARCCNVEFETGNLGGTCRSTQGTFYRRTPMGDSRQRRGFSYTQRTGGAHGQIYSIAHALDHFSSPVLPTEYLWSAHHLNWTCREVECVYSNRSTWRCAAGYWKGECPRALGAGWGLVLPYTSTPDLVTTPHLRFVQ